MKRDEQKDLKVLADAFFRELFISDCEYGGIGLDPKRPFGNSSVERDMLELLDAAPEGDGDETESFSDAQCEYVRDLYHEKLVPYLRRRWQELNS